MNLKLAILRVLAQHSEHYLSFDEIRREMFKLGGRLEDSEVLFSLAGDDIFRSGLISRNVHGWRITEAGLSTLQSSSTSESSLSMLLEQLDVIEWSARWKSKLRPSGETDEADEGASVLSEGGESEAATDRLFPNIESSNNGDPYGKTGMLGATDGTKNAIAYHAAATGTAGVAMNSAAVSKTRSRLRGDSKSRLSSLLATFASAKKIVLLRNLELRAARTSINFKARAMGRWAGRHASFALLGLLVCAIAVVLLTQISLVRSDAELQREISRLRANFSKLEQTIRTEENDSEKSSSASASREPRIEQTALQLSREETQLIKDFIKPAPSFSASGTTAAVGDPIEGTLVPLPPALVEKAPRLAGARFAIRSSNIIIVTKGSNKVDAVLPGN